MGAAITDRAAGGGGQLTAIPADADWAQFAFAKPGACQGALAGPRGAHGGLPPSWLP